MTRAFRTIRQYCVGSILLTSMIAPLQAAGAQQAVANKPLGTVIGFIADSSGVSVAGAIVTVLGAATTRSDSLGNFVVHSVPAGRVVIWVRKLGYAPAGVTTQLAAGGTASVPVVMHPLPHVLPGIQVNARTDTMQTPDYYGSHKYDLFYHRRATSLGGIFYTHAQIARRMPAKLSDLLEGKAARLPRCQSAAVNSGGSGYRLFIDDLPFDQQASGEEALKDLDAIPWDWVEGLEIYTGPSQLPVEAMGNACAAIFIWMRSIVPDSN